jgi:hypothetical protein
MKWGEREITHKAAPIEIVDRRDGQGLRPQFVGDDVETVPLQNAAIRIVE